MINLLHFEAFTLFCCKFALIPIHTFLCKILTPKTLVGLKVFTNIMSGCNTKRRLWNKKTNTNVVKAKILWHLTKLIILRSFIRRVPKWIYKGFSAILKDYILKRGLKIISVLVNMVGMASLRRQMQLWKLWYFRRNWK